MSKIRDLMTTLRRVIGGSDRSDTPQLRKLAETYASVCQETAAKLDECRSLLAMGLPVDARSVNVSVTPSLAERVRLLALSDAERKVWRELCRLYHYPEAPALDVGTARLLVASAGEEARDSGLLIMRWRKMARTGGALEKITLLRQILHAVPDNNAAVWRDNLRQVERQFVAEIVKELPQILKENDSHKIMRIFETLTNPELSVKPPEEALAKLRPVVTAIQKAELDAQLHEALAAITAAYSAMDEGGMRTAVEAYDKLAANPLHEASPEEKRQLREVRQHLEDCRSRAKKEEKSKRETAELFTLLNDHGPLDRINMLYESLRQLDLPLAKTLAERVDARREADAMEATRRYRRRGLLAILGAILLLAAGAAAVVILNWYSEAKNTAVAWQKQLDEDNPAAVLEMYEKLKQEKPHLLKFGRLRELQMEAQRKEEARLADIQRCAALLDEAEKLVSAEQVDVVELAKRVSALEALSPNALSPEAGKRLRHVSQVLRALEMQAQQERDDAFSQQWTEFSQRCDEWRNELANPESDLEALAATPLFEEGDALFRSSDGISQTLYEPRQKAWTERKSGMQKQLDDERERRKYMKSLTEPPDFQSYMTALDKLPERMPFLAQGEWQKALAAKSMFYALALSGKYHSQWRSREEFDKRARELQPFMRKTPFTEDVCMLLPERFTEEMTRQKEELEKRLCSIPEVYELQAIDQQGKPYYFYSAQKPDDRDKKYSSAFPKTIRMEIFYRKDSQETVPLLLRVLQENDKVTLTPHNFTTLALPTNLRYVQQSGAWRTKAPHVEFMEALREALQLNSTPESAEQTILSALKNLQSMENMNVLLQASLMRQLLLMLPLTSKLYEKSTRVEVVKLDSLALGHYESWMVPNAVAAFDDAGRLRDRIRVLNVDRLRERQRLEKELFTVALQRNVGPVGILLPDGDQGLRVHWFTRGRNAREVWLPLWNQKTQQVSFGLIPRSKLQADSLPAEGRSAGYPGMVIFAPFDGKDTAKLAGNFATRARRFGIGTLQWPQSWPVNCRDAAAMDQ